MLDSIAENLKKMGRSLEKTYDDAIAYDDLLKKIRKNRGKYYKDELREPFDIALSDHINTWGSISFQAGKDALTEFESKKKSEELERKQKEAWILGLADNLVWVTSVFVPPIGVGTEFIKRMGASFGGPGVNVSGVKPSSVTAINQNINNLLDALSTTESDALIDGAIAYTLNYKNCPASEIGHKEAKEILWQFMFGFPLSRGRSELLIREKKAALKTLMTYDSLYEKWNREISATGMPSGMHFVSVQDEILKKDTPFNKWVVNRPEIRDVEAYRKNLIR